jgi:hypothetical protein
MHQPLKLRQVDTHQTAWRVAMDSILKTVRITLPHINAQSAPVFHNMWIKLASAVDDFLFGDDGQIVEWGTEDIDQDVTSLRHGNEKSFFSIIRGKKSDFREPSPPKQLREL